MKKRLCVLLGASAALLIAALLLLTRPWSWQTLDLDKINAPAQATLVYDRDGRLADELGARRTLLHEGDVPEVAAQAFVAIEDARFYRHHGVDLYRIGGALISNLKSGSAREGASTITQQLIKLTHLSSEKTIARKAQEAYLALKLERAMGKDDILRAYLNTVYFGAGAYGLEEAAQTYFSHPASELTLDEAALLAGIVKSPSGYAPHVNPEKALERRNLVLSQMEKCGYIDEETMLAAQKAPVTLHMKETSAPGGWYVDAVTDEACRALSMSADQLMSGGYRIYTALDRDLQASADALFADDTLFPSADEDGARPEAAMAALDCATGELLSLRGGRDYQVQRGFNRATQMQRQPGSAFKPVSVYAAAVDLLGCTPITLLDDTPRDYDGYSPSNASGRSHGVVTLRQALVKSMTQATVNLLDRVGIDAARMYAGRFGIELSDEDVSYALGLGALHGGVSPATLAAAYGALGNGGMAVSPHTIRRIEDARGKVVYEYRAENKRALSEQSAYLITDVLRDTARTGTARALNDAGVAVAAKTGTVGETDGGNRDAWTAAYTPRTALVVWMGYDDPAAHELAQGVTGGSFPARWAAAYIRANRTAFEQPFIQPDGLNNVMIDARSLEADVAAPMLASEDTPNAYILRESLPDGGVPAQTSNLWTQPKTVETVYSWTDGNGRTAVSFVAPDSVSVWRVIRRSDSGAETEIARLTGSEGEYLSATDEESAPGASYYVVARQKYYEEAGEIVESSASQLAEGGGKTLIERLLTVAGRP